MTKKTFVFATIAAVVSMACIPAQARPHGGPGGGPHGGFHGGPGPRHHYHDRWYNGPLGWTAGLIGAGIVAGAVDAAIGPRYYQPSTVVVQQPAPTVVQQPVVVQQQPVVVQQPAPVVIQQQPAPVVQTAPATATTGQRVWVEGHWQVQQDAYGNPVRRTWVDGYWQNVQ